MTTITVSIPDDRLRKLQEVAERYQLTPEELVRISVEDLLARPDDNVQQAVSFVLDKNAELYQRLS